MSGGSDEATLRAECEAMGACACCILRFRGVPSGEVDEYRAAASALKDEPPCPCCLGILQLDLDVSTAREREGADAAEASAPNGEDDATNGTAAAADARNRSDVLVRVDPPAVHARCVYPLPSWWVWTSSSHVRSRPVERTVRCRVEVCGYLFGT